MSPSYDADTGHLFITFREFGDRYFKRHDEYKPGRVYMGGKTMPVEDQEWGGIKAINVDTGNSRLGVQILHRLALGGCSGNRRWRSVRRQSRWQSGGLGQTQRKAAVAVPDRRAHRFFTDELCRGWRAIRGPFGGKRAVQLRAGAAVKVNGPHGSWRTRPTA